MVDGFRFKVFRRGEDVGGVDATVEFGFGGTGYEGDFVAVVGARGFDELFLDFDAADGTEREGVLDAPGKIAAAGTDVHDGTSSAFRVRHGFSFQQKFDHRTRGGATRVQDLRSHVVVVFVDVLYEAFVVSRVFHDAFLIVVVVVVVVVTRCCCCCCCCCSCSCCSRGCSLRRRYRHRPRCRWRRVQSCYACCWTRSDSFEFS